MNYINKAQKTYLTFTLQYFKVVLLGPAWQELTVLISWPQYILRVKSFYDVYLKYHSSTKPRIKTSSSSHKNSVADPDPFHFGQPDPVRFNETDPDPSGKKSA